jgi:hypothetical protein
LPKNTVDFAALPPHFAVSVRSGAGCLLPEDQEWAALVPKFEKLPASFRATMPFLLVSLCHHTKKLRTVMPADHLPQRCMPLVVSIAWPHVRTGNFACLETGLVATGVPPLVDLLRNMSENRRELLEAQAKHAADIERLSAITVTESAATRQLIAGVSGQLRALDEGVAGLPRVLLDELSTDNALNHARPLTREDMLRVVNSSVEQAVQDIRADLADLRAAFAAPLAPVA